MGVVMFKRKTERRKAPVSTLSNIFHGIAIEPGDVACTAVQRLTGERYLCEDAPKLPLDACECAQDCRCVYRHFFDRRTDVRRDADMGLPHRDVPGDKRMGAGRRITDG